MKQVARQETSLQILIAGRDMAVNEALGEVLTCDQPGLTIAGVATGVIQALSIAEALKPDVILFDLDTPHPVLTHVVGILKLVSPTPVLIVLAHETTASLQRLCKAAGAAHVFNKTSELEPLIKQLRVFRDTKRHLPHKK